MRPHLRINEYIKHCRDHISSWPKVKHVVNVSISALCWHDLNISHDVLYDGFLPDKMSGYVA